MRNNEDLIYNYGCASCGYGEPGEHIDIGRMIDKLDSLFDKNDLPAAGRLLDYWRSEAVRLRDLRGELSVTSEQMGYYRKTNDSVGGLEAVERGLTIIDRLGLAETVSAGTIFLNAATTLKAFGRVDEALMLYGKARVIYDAELTTDDTRFAGFYNNYALALADIGRYTEAEEAYKKAIDITGQEQDGKPDAAISYINLAQLYVEMINRTSVDIIFCMDKALELLFDEDNTKNGYYYFVLSKCAPAYRDAGYDEIADELERQVTAYREGT